MKVFVTGGSGLIGSKFVEEFGKGGADVSYSYLSRDFQIAGGEAVQLDITDADAVANAISSRAPDLVVHCSALTKVDLCETDPMLAERINVQGTRNVVDACVETDSKIIYMSTSFVFDGSKDVFNEDDITNPLNVYGRTKLESENIVRDSDQPFVILRTDQPYRWSPQHLEKNNIMRLIGLFERGEKFREPEDWFNTPTLVDNVVEAAIRIAKKWDDGIYHAVGPDYLSRYETAMMVADMVGGNKSLVERVNSRIFNLPTERPNVHMVNNKLQEKTGVEMLGIEDGIRLVLKQKEESNR